MTTYVVDQAGEKSVAISTDQDTQSDLYSIAVCLHIWDTHI